MKPKNSKTVQKIAHKMGPKKKKPADPTTDFDSCWSYLEDEPEMAYYLNEYEAAPEVRYFN